MSCEVSHDSLSSLLLISEIMQCNDFIVHGLMYYLLHNIQTICFRYSHAYYRNLKQLHYKLETISKRQYGYVGLHSYSISYQLKFDTLAVLGGSKFGMLFKKSTKGRRAVKVKLICYFTNGKSMVCQQGVCF